MVWSWGDLYGNPISRSQEYVFVNNCCSIIDVNIDHDALLQSIISRVATLLRCSVSQGYICTLSSVFHQTLAPKKTMRLEVINKYLITARLD